MMEQQQQDVLPHGMVCVNDSRFNESNRETLRALYLAGWATRSERYPRPGQSCSDAGITSDKLQALMLAANLPIDRPRDRPPQIVDNLSISNNVLQAFSLAVHLVPIPWLDPIVARIRGEIVTGAVAISDTTASRLREQYPELHHWSITDFQVAWGNYARELRGDGGLTFERDEIFLVYLHIVRKHPTYSFAGDLGMPGAWEAYAREKPWETDAPVPRGLGFDE